MEGSVEIGDLRRFTLLRDVEAPSLREMLQQGRLHQLEPGAVLIHAGRMPPGLHFVLEGSLAVRLEGPEAETVAEVGPGESVGELSVIDGIPPCAWVVALEPARVLSLEAASAWALTRSSHSFCLALLHNLAERLRANNLTVESASRRRREAEQAALLDGLTGVCNRRWIEERLPPLAAQCGSRLALALLDIDYFKRFNDTYGHQAGDDVLRGVADTLRTQLRPKDVLARYGGEEFVVALPGLRREAAAAVADRLRGSLENLQIRSSEGELLPPITVSIGVAVQEQHMGCEGLIAAADGALYQAKEGGRNRVVLASAAPA
ncbi:MAG: GGDEF domain-containing protein [Synechococcus sp.]|nr:GGDEF domain-containing protein [Synechococcus sp.]